jgi:ADP-ribosylglycohydrolase/fructose-1,6-bisphosphatase/inositol monophosphatase family enzyme
VETNYQRALEVAVQAAQAAGEILRADFHRAGGPRGEHGKAPADTEAEHAIRSMLTGAFPHWRYRGEETGESVPDAAEPHLWLVDPSDGTTSFLRGFRGPAVSIGLLRGGEPVLGVVFAFAAPDDRGDLFAWAEGCGPLRRNGKPVDRAAWAEQLDRFTVVLISRGADRRPRANAETVAPARFLAVPSIAYRLALAAAGDAAVAASLNSPGAWDYAAGHALLRATGGELVNECGEPVRYSPDGHSKTQFCFGGAPKLAREVARRDWARVTQTPLDEPEEYDLVRPLADQHIADAALLSRAQGCLLGEVVGDSVGCLVEFSSAEQIALIEARRLFGLDHRGTWGTLPGQPTDDSEMALLLARTLVAAGVYEAERVGRAYHFWMHSEPFDRGMTVTHALHAITDDDLAAGRAAEKARSVASRESQANGALMRVSPLAIWGHALPAEELAAHARADASLTHPHPVCQDANAVYVVAVAHAIATGAGPREVWQHALDWAQGAGPREVWQHALDWAHAQKVQAAVQQALGDAESRPPKDYQSWAAGWVLVALQNAFYRLLHARDFEQGLTQTVLCGGDTDTNGAIAGALLGAVHGRDAIPLHWRQMTLSCRPISGLDEVEYPRPRGVWPVDAMVLAERLLISGRSKGVRKPGS